MTQNYLLHNKAGLYIYDPSIGKTFSTNHLTPSEKRDLITKSIIVTDIVFKPNQAEWVSIGNYYQHNIYKKYEPKHDKTDNITGFLELMNRLFPVIEDYKTVMQYFAHMIQKPNERPSFALLITSDSGTGKGFLYSKILRPLLSNQTEQVDNYSLVFDRFSKTLYMNLLCCLDDPKSNHPSTMAKLKSAITEPTRRVEDKHGEQYTVDTYTRLIIFSNERVPLKLNESDVRRLYAPTYITHRDSLAETQDFIESIADKLDIDCIYNYLSTYPIDDFNPYQPRQTETLLDMLGASVTYLQESIEDYANRNKVFTFADLKRSVGDYRNEADIRLALNDLGLINTRKCIGGKDYRLWHLPSINKSDLTEHFDPFFS